MVAYEIETFDEAIEYIGDQLGSDFLKALNLADDIITNPENYDGIRARKSAMLMAAYRLKVGVVAQKAKLTRSERKLPQDRLKADALMCMYDALQEVINTLKLIGRADHDMVSGY